MNSQLSRKNKSLISKSELNILPLLGKFQKPLRLFTRDDKPVTDREGFILRDIAGKNLATVEIERNIFLDLKGFNLTDAAGKVPLVSHFDPTSVPLYEKDGTDPSEGIDCHIVIYDINGIPLTDRNGRPLVSRSGKMYLSFDPRGQPVSDLRGQDIIDRFGQVITKNKPLRDKNCRQLYYFDHEGKPLTDHDSFVLLDITGMPMVVFDEDDIAPIKTLFGTDLYDAEGVWNGEVDCDFAKLPRFVDTNIKITTKDGEPAVAFDLSGCPLSDLLGNPLCFNNGKCMINYALKKWTSYNHEPVTILPRKVYDRFTLRGFTNSSGHPIRVFDDYGRPLTDLDGTPQRHASGKLLIKFNISGSPVSDWLDRPLYDAAGQIIGSRYFRPCLPYSKQHVYDKIPRILGIQYFESTGMPLTNSLGYPLLNAKEQPMVIFDKDGEPMHDYRKKTVYNVLGLPKISSLDFPLLGPGGVPIRLYDETGKPLTDSTGIPLKDVRGRHMIKIYPNNLEITDVKGRNVYDKNGCSTNMIYQFNASGGPDNIDKQEMIIAVDGEPMNIYDEEGYPLSEQSGVVLYDRFGKSMIKCPEQGFTTTLDDKPVYDVNGRKCLKIFSKHLGLSVGLYDKNSRPLTDRYGSVLRNRKGQDLVIFDKCFRPISALVGGELYDLKGMPLNHPFADPSKIAKYPLKQTPDASILFDCEDLPLTDASGYVLYTSFGIPMVNFDTHGRVKCDHSGRAVYDIRGLAVSRNCGAWKDQSGLPYRLFTSENMPVTDENGRELYDIRGKSLLHQDNIGRPMYTANNHHVKDSKGRRFVDFNFKPTIFMAKTKRICPLLEEDRTPLRIYDVEGNPLTDVQGQPVVNSKGEFLLNMKNGLSRFTDLKRRQVYDRFRMPLGCTHKTNIKTINGLPLMLFDDKGMPLTDENGLPLRREGNKNVMIMFDVYGRPSTTESGGQLFDHAGRCSQHPQFGLIEEMNKPSTSNESESLIAVYDNRGRPMTDINGHSLQ